MTEVSAREMALTAHDIVQRIRPLLAGHPPAVQSAALADLLAWWLVGHRRVKPAPTNRLREILLRDHVNLVRRLVPVNEALLNEAMSGVVALDLNDPASVHHTIAKAVEED